MEEVRIIELKETILEDNDQDARASCAAEIGKDLPDRNHPM